MAKELFFSIESEKGGIQGLNKFLDAAMQEGRDLSPEERQLIQTLLFVSRTLIARISTGSHVNSYLRCAIIMASLAGKKRGAGGEEPAGSDAWREATLKELRGVVDKYRDDLIRQSPSMFRMMNLASAKVLRRLGRFQEAIALAQQELPAMEAMPWEKKDAFLIIDYYEQLAGWIIEGDGPERSLRRQDWLYHDWESIKQSMEAETMLKKGLERAEKEPSIDRGTVGVAVI
jgi:hypothetical protein